MSTKKWVVVFSFLLFISYFSFTEASSLLATSGCCSHHGGVCGCDTSTGSQQCCDGTDSPSCTCQYIPPKPTTAPAPIKTIVPKTETAPITIQKSDPAPIASTQEKIPEIKSVPTCPPNNDEYPTFITLLFLASGFVNFILAIIAFVFYRKSKNLSKNILPKQ